MAGLFRGPLFFEEISCSLFESLYTNRAINSNEAHFVKPHSVFTDNHLVIITGIGVSPGGTLLPDLPVIEIKYCLATPAAKRFLNGGVELIGGFCLIRWIGQSKVFFKCRASRLSLVARLRCNGRRDRNGAHN